MRAPPGDGVIERNAIFGTTGDLAARYLLPGLARCGAAGQLGGRFKLARAGREAWDTEDFRQWAAAQLGLFDHRFLNPSAGGMLRPPSVPATSQ